ncbi:MAG: cytosine deaminase, partial [Pseudomonadota bacterium]
ERVGDLTTASRAGRWKLSRVRLPAVLICGEVTSLPNAGEDLFLADIVIAGSKIETIAPPGALEAPAYDAKGGVVFPGLIDCHTHLDKGHVWPRSRNEDGSFSSAIEAVANDQGRFWTADDLRRRMNFAVAAAYAHGTVAIRTHLDCWPEAPYDPWSIFRGVAETWAGRVDLMAAALIGIADVDDDAFMEHLVRQAKAADGAAIGAFVRAFPEDLAELPSRLDRFLRRAQEAGLPVDFHVDETTDPASLGLRSVAEAVLRTSFDGPILCGHCVAPAGYEDNVLAETLDLAASAGIGIVSLPLCNAYLLDRQTGRTPQRRAMAPVHEMRNAGIEVALGSDNTRDPFNAYGDLDLFEIYRFATLTQHLDHPVGDWPAAITSTPAGHLGIGDRGRIAAGAAADLILLSARGWSELIARPQSDRIVLRNGLPLTVTAPEYGALDELAGLDDLSSF